MNGKQLKNSILQWAIQGKLVPQDPNDEPARVLLDKIRQEKERLIKEKKIKRDKNASIIYRGEDNSYYEKFLATGEVKCIDEEIPFEIPRGWEWTRLDELVTYQNGYSYTSVELNKENKGLPVIKSGNLMTYEVELKPNNDYVEFPTDKMLASLIRKGDMLMCLSSQSDNPEPLGKTAIYKNDNYALLNQRVLKMRPYLDDILTYLYYVINSEYFHYTVSHQGGGSAQANLKLGHVLSMLVPIAPFKEELRIVNKISKLNPLIAHYDLIQQKECDLNNEINDKLKKSILQEAIQGRLVPQIPEEGTAQELLEQIQQEKSQLIKECKLKKSALTDSIIFKGDDNKYYEQIGKKCLDITDEIPFVIPETWQWVRIRDVFQLNPKNEAEDEKLVAFIPMEKISAGYKSDFTFDTAKWGTIKKGFTHFANGDVAFAKITPCFQNRKSAIFHDLPNGIGAGTTELKVLRPYGNTINRWYLLYFLESPYFIDEATFKGTANQQRIVVGYLEDKLFPLPTQKEQQRIVAQIEKLFEQLH